MSEGGEEEHQRAGRNRQKRLRPPMSEGGEEENQRA
jgi:hypothetical protein